MEKCLLCYTYTGIGIGFLKVKQENNFYNSGFEINETELQETPSEPTCGPDIPPHVRCGAHLLLVPDWVATPLNQLITNPWTS